MKISKLAPFLIAIISSTTVIASSYQLPITRNGQTTTRVAYYDWLGEYPGPVINVNAQKQGVTTITAFKSLRKLDKHVPCTIKNGLYHPWAKRHSVINFYSLTPLITYQATQNTSLENIPIPKGAIIDNVHGLSEGYCSGLLKSAGKPEEIQFFCDYIENNSFKKLKKEDGFYEQWLYVKCQQGYNAFIQDKALLKQPGVKQGKIIHYGKVGF